MYDEIMMNERRRKEEVIRNGYQHEAEQGCLYEGGNSR